MLTKGPFPMGVWALDGAGTGFRPGPNQSSVQAQPKSLIEGPKHFNYEK